MLRPKKKLKPSPDLPPPPPIRDDVGKIPNHTPSRRWEELHVDCLANVFPKVGMESLLLALPFVCKSWYAPSLNPLCWKFLHFPEFEPYPLFTAVADTNAGPKSFGPFYDKFVVDYRIDAARFSITGFVKLAVDRSDRNAVELKLPQFCTEEEALRYAADGCPGVRYLHFADDLVLFKHSRILAEVIGKWKLLEHLTLGGNMLNIMGQYQVKSGEHLSRDFEESLFVSMDSMRHFRNNNLYEILVQVGIHCKRMRSLHVFDGYVGEEEALAIVKGLPNLVFLTLGQSRFEGSSLVTLLKGCKKLCGFDVWNCEGVVMDGEEMRNLGSHIKEFRWRDVTGHKCFHVLKMIILSRAKLNILKQRHIGLGIV